MISKTKNNIKYSSLITAIEKSTLVTNSIKKNPKDYNKLVSGMLNTMNKLEKKLETLQTEVTIAKKQLFNSKNNVISSVINNTDYDFSLKATIDNSNSCGVQLELQVVNNKNFTSNFTSCKNSVFINKNSSIDNWYIISGILDNTELLTRNSSGSLFHVNLNSLNENCLILQFNDSTINEMFFNPNTNDLVKLILNKKANEKYNIILEDVLPF